MKYKIIGPHAIRGFAPGTIIDLDPAEVNIPALVESGHVEEFSPPSAKPPRTPRTRKRTEEETGGETA